MVALLSVVYDRNATIGPRAAPVCPPRGTTLSLLGL